MTQRDIESYIYEFEIDGYMWCCHECDFVNLQESKAGFGITRKEALFDLLKQLNNDLL